MRANRSLSIRRLPGGRDSQWAGYDLFLSGRQQARRIENERQLGCNMNERRQQRIEKPNCCQPNADSINNQRAIKVLEYDGAATPGDADGFHELLKVVANQNHVGAFAGDVRSASHGHADGGVHERGSVVDAVAEHGHDSPALSM